MRIKQSEVYAKVWYTFISRGLQDTCGLTVLYVFSGLKKNFKKKIPPRFLDYHRVSMENLWGNFVFHHVPPLARC